MRLRRWAERAGVEAARLVRSEPLELPLGLVATRSERQFSLQMLDLGLKRRAFAVDRFPRKAQRDHLVLEPNGRGGLRPGHRQELTSNPLDLLDGRLGRLALLTRPVSPHVFRVRLTHSYTPFLTPSYNLTEGA